MRKNFKIAEFADLEKSCILRKKITVPSRDDFCYIHEKAREGNEMALMLLFEWIEFCSPENTKERQVYNNINCAFKELFK